MNKNLRRNHVNLSLTIQRENAFRRRVIQHPHSFHFPFHPPHDIQNPPFFFSYSHSHVNLPDCIVQSLHKPRRIRFSISTHAKGTLQKSTISSMPLQNHSTDSVQDLTLESNKRSANLQELEMPLSSEEIINSSESEKTDNPQESDCISHVPNKISHDDEEEHKCDAEVATTVPTKSEGTVEDSSSGRERLKRHRVEVAGRVWIPDMWGQEDFLKDWIDCAAFDASLVNSTVMSARASLVEEGRRANSTRLRVENSC